MSCADEEKFGVSHGGKVVIGGVSMSERQPADAASLFQSCAILARRRTAKNAQSCAGDAVPGNVRSTILSRMPTRAVLLVNLGSPDSPSVSDVRRYLREFLGDGRVIDIPRP